MSTKKEKNKEYREAKKRLEKAQAKYTVGYKSNGTRKAPRSARSANARRWHDWRTTDGKKYPVT